MLPRNVDRLFAVWQALNPTSYEINQPAGDGTFVISASSVETDKTPLAPFNDASGQKYWTSDGIRDTQTFNYAYPETQRWAFSNDLDYRNSVQNAVNELYGGVVNQLTGNQGLDSVFATSAPVAAVHTTKLNRTNGPAHETSDGNAEKPLAAAPPNDGHKSGSNPIRNVVGKARSAFLGSSSSVGHGIREPGIERKLGNNNSTAPCPGSYRSFTRRRKLTENL